MMIKPIKERNDHEAAKERIEALIQLSATQEITDEIEVLATLVEKYEREAIVVA